MFKPLLSRYKLKDSSVLIKLMEILNIFAESNSPKAFGLVFQLNEIYR
jgi:hypothetical protein